MVLGPLRQACGQVVGRRCASHRLAGALLVVVARVELVLDVVEERLDRPDPPLRRAAIRN
jgi:hypothetical protein